MGTDLVTNYTVLQAAISIHSAHVGTIDLNEIKLVEIDQFYFIAYMGTVD